MAEPGGRRILALFTHPDGERNWLEDGVVEEVRKRFDGRVEHMLVESV